MKLFKQFRRERALARFRIKSEVEFNNGRKGSGKNVGRYEDYLARKEQERKALESRS